MWFGNAKSVYYEIDSGGIQNEKKNYKRTITIADVYPRWYHRFD
jgi:hypothetical protein